MAQQEGRQDEIDGRVEVMPVRMVRAENDGAEVVSEILTEAARWLIERGGRLWEPSELTAEKIAPEVRQGLFWLALTPDGEHAGCIRYQLSDPEYWDDVPHEDSAFVHRVAVRRRFAGAGVSRQMIEWAKERARSDGKKFLRLDCAKREKLRRIYEGFGFRYHSEKRREPYLVVRYEYDLERGGA